MASSEAPILILNCGNTHVSAAMFSKDQDDILCLLEAHVAPLEYDFTREDAWLVALTEAVRQLRKEARLPNRGIFILPGNKFLTKQLQVPHVDPAKQRQVIAVEAQQSIPHIFSQVEWDSQILQDDGIEVDVLFLAAKKEELKEFYNAMKSAGVTATEITASSVLDYNTFLHTYPDLEDECILLNIGARTANLLFANKDGFMARTINLGGNVLTQNLSEALGIPFEEAERNKVAYCMGELDLDDDDPFVEVLEAQRIKFLKRLNQELTRSVVTYRNQRKKPPPQFLLVTGKGSLLYGLTEFIGEKQGLEIHHMDPLGNVTLADPGIAEEWPLLQYELSESVGEAVRVAFPDRDGVGVNLLPTSIQRKVTMGRRKPVILLASLFMALAPIYPCLQMQEQITDYEQKLGRLKERNREIQKYKKTIRVNMEDCDRLKAEIGKLEDLVNSRYNWIKFFGEVQESLQRVEDVWLEDLSILRSERRESIPPEGRNELPEIIVHRDYQVKLKGRLLLRGTPGNADVQPGNESEKQRIIELKKSIEKSDFINEASYNISNEGRFLGFNIELTINPEKPL